MMAERRARAERTTLKMRKLPNIVYILADDMGYGDVSCLNPDSKLNTVNIDAMARGGMRCTDMHSTSAVCTPSRYGILTGKSATVIQGLKRISKPGLRVYAPSDALPKVLGGLGIAIISTSKGVMTDKDARKQGVGGEVLAYVW